MAIYQSRDAKLSVVREAPFAREREMQCLVEAHMDALLGLQFVRSEFSIGDFRIDSLVYDHSSNAFAIVEYKKDKNFSVIDQGYAYLSTMLNNKADFILEYNEVMQHSLQRSEVDWSQSRVIFVAPSFTSYQRQAINFQDMPIELWELKRFENDFISFNKIKSDGARESIQTLSSETVESPIKEVNKEITVVTEAQHLAGKPEPILDLYRRLKEHIMSLGDVELKSTKLWLGFRTTRNFVDIHLQNSALKMWLNMPAGTLNDPLNLARDVSNVGHWGNGSYELKIVNDERFSYLFDLIEQSYNYQLRVG